MCNEITKANTTLKQLVFTLKLLNEPIMYVIVSSTYRLALCCINTHC